MLKIITSSPYGSQASITHIINDNLVSNINYMRGGQNLVHAVVQFSWQSHALVLILPDTYAIKRTNKLLERLIDRPIYDGRSIRVSRLLEGVTDPKAYDKMSYVKDILYVSSSDTMIHFTTTNGNWFIAMKDKTYVEKTLRKLSKFLLNTSSGSDLILK